MSLGIMCCYHYIHVCTTMLGQSRHSENTCYMKDSCKDHRARESRSPPITGSFLLTSQLPGSEKRDILIRRD